ncbi:MAG: hypothetical protein IJU84_07910 [Clostridia bacterium]|nr:hypothetical protein [Clostridia bacterium]MBQ9482071.1 hypothetical protein [Clostridia bacterium]
MERKYIYVIVSATYTKAAKVIRLATKSVYNHVSISFDENMRELYSFARLYYCLPFVGGPVKETYDRLSLNRPENVSVKVYKIPVKASAYYNAYARVREIFSDGEYAYNLISAFTFLFRHGVERYKTFTCSEFVSHIMRIARPDVMPEVADCKIVPDDFTRLLAPYEIYGGPLNGFNDFTESSNEEFFSKIGFVPRWFMTYNYIKARYGKSFAKGH